MAVELSQNNFKKKIERGTTLIDFYAPWCGPCKMMSPVVDELAKDYKGRAGVYKVNVDNEPELANKSQVMNIPTTIIFKDGKAVDQIIGTQSKKKLKEVIEKNL